MKNSQTAMALCGAFSIFGCTDQGSETAENTLDPVDDTAVAALAEASLAAPDGGAAGDAVVQLSDGGASITVTATGLSAGSHGFHIHETGTCTAPDFKSAGGHLNPLGKSHGSLSDGGSHVGDLPNLEIAEDGEGTFTAKIEGSRQQVQDWLFDADGSAVVIHAEADDYKTDPSGDAGARVACGVLKPA